MFRRRSGIHPAVLVLGSAALTAAFSPEIRKRLTGMFAKGMGARQQGNGRNQTMMNPADMIKQAFNPGGQSNEHGQSGYTANDQHQSSQMTAPVNVMNDQTANQTMFDNDQSYS
ncbi:hypothetical protein CHCC14820_1547 [Bacillus paralicheniformis]|uniref:Uncharacterized protein n=1 Tax=Bacillus paralicheniformis TaxID=1648923 RepID=A0AAW6KHM0_9BACI|nr:hypothetical protein [Bacillus paralicheniformis]KUL15622.1 hypothetical protein LI6934_19630 [Bacillus licheniformis LMG 6934]MBG9882893.1 hypothetical protein [Bacillus paralicheniformis]MDE1393944.1 hypothetical protein [Bacillus paralicheniformis]MDE1455459.1 hypothetical protein [Bacillus paralicheniformis]MED0807325.1 hypothetical protein [Bacillus paralicheniformis]